MAERTRYQENIIKRYYDNRDSISVQRLQELATELFLTTGKKRAQQWKLVVGHLEKLKIPQARIDRLVKDDKPEKVAELVQELLNKSS